MSPQSALGERRLRVGQVSRELIFEWFTLGWHTDWGQRLTCIQGLPEGAVYVGSSMDQGDVFFVFYHPSFEPVAYSVPPPNQPVHWQTSYLSERVRNVLNGLIRDEKEASDVAL